MKAKRTPEQLEVIRPDGVLVNHFYDDEDDKTIPFEKNLAVMVYPLGAKHLRRFSTQIVGILSTLSQVRVPKNQGEEALYQTMVAQAVPSLMSEGFDLLQDTCVVGEMVSVGPNEMKFIAAETQDNALDELPHWELPTVLEAWVELSFGTSGKRRPWIKMLNNLGTKLTKKKKFSITDLFSASSESADTRSTKSSTDNTKVSPTGD